MTKAIILDMDDTLYLERDYVISGFSAAAEALESNELSNAFLKQAISIFENGNRGNIFNLALKALNQCDNPLIVSDMLTRYREHLPSISLCTDATRFLEDGKGKFPIGLISDGYLPPQSQKVKALGLDRLIEKIVLTESLGREFWKPHTKAFKLIESHFGLQNSSCIYVGDNPRKDFDAPKLLGWTTIRIRRAGSLHYNSPDKPNFEPDYQIENFEDLPSILAA